MVASRGLPGSFKMIALAVSAGVLGAVTAALSNSPLPMLALLAAAAAYVLMQLPGAWRIEYALLGIVILCCTVIDMDTLPLIPIAIGSLNPADIILVGMGAIVVIRGLVMPGPRITRSGLTLPLVVFFMLVIVSVINATVSESGTRHRILSELRTVAFLLLSVIVPQYITRLRQLRFVLRGLTVIAATCAIIMVAQAFVGPSIALIPTSLVSVNTAVYAETGLFRVTPPAQALIRTVLILLAAEWLLTPPGDRARWLVPIMLLMGVALLVTSNRNYWVGTGVSLLLAASLIDTRSRFNALISGIRVTFVIAAIALMTLVLFDMLGIPAANQLIDTTLLRLDPESPVANIDSSLATREEELYYIDRALTDHLLIGIGLGANYQPLRWYESPAFNRMYYTHNAYLWILLKMGITGFVAFAWLIGACIHQTLTRFHQPRAVLSRAVMLAAGTLIVGLLFSAPFSPVFMEWFWTPMIGLTVGLSEAALRLEM